MAKVPGNSNEIQFWKTVGGYTAAAKLGKRWYLIGENSCMALSEFEDFCRQHGLKPTRGRYGEPAAVKALYTKHGRKGAVLRDRMPKWKDSQWYKDRIS